MRGCLLLVAVASVGPALCSSPAPVAAQVDGKAVYDRWCAGCHGVEGRGDGPAADRMFPRPRDFTLGLYQVRTTGTGQLPSDADILHVIDVGMPGTAMPAWEDVLSGAERQALVEYLKDFSRFFANSPAPEPLTFSRPPRADDERLARGREVYELIECNRCHGVEGRGDGSSAPTLKDDTDLPVAAADLTQNWRFNGGPTVADVYRRLRTGMDGTPMPSFSDLVDSEVITADDLWSLAHYVRSLSPEEAPRVREVIVAAWTPGSLPTAVDDERWGDVDRYYVPLVGQIIAPPRWFNPRVSALWVQAAHDGEELAVRVSWSDPSRSPDPDWNEYLGRVLGIMARDEGAATGPGPGDRLAVQFPRTTPEGMERPYFLHGDSRRPAYLWTWESPGDGATEAVARGLGSDQAQHAGAGHLRAEASNHEGQWQVVFRRALSTGDEEDPAFAVGSALPVAFQAWDGDNGEVGAQGAVSTWYFLSLEQPTPITAYVAPGLAFVLTLGLGLLVTRGARRAEREGGRSAQHT